jgi:hypothetical protein
MQRIQKFMPLFFSVIYIGIPAAVNIYFIISSLARIGQQELMFRYDPQVRSHAAIEKPVDRASGKKPIDVKEVKPGAPTKKPGGQAPRRDTSAKADGDGDRQADRQRSGRQRSRSAQPKAIEANATNGEANATNGEAKATNGEAKATNGEAKATNGEAKATNGSESADRTSNAGPDGRGDGTKAPDGTRSPGGGKSPASGGGRSPGGAKAPDGSRTDWSKAPRQKPHRSQSKRTRKSR